MDDLNLEAELDQAESDVRHWWRMARRLRRALKQATGELRLALRHQHQVRRAARRGK